MGQKAVEFALAGDNAVMPIIVRTSQKPYRWRIDKVKLSRVANREKKMPRNFISKDGFGITEPCRRYLEPLIQGEDYPPYQRGLPRYASLRLAPVAKLLGEDFMLE